MRTFITCEGDQIMKIRRVGRVARMIDMLNEYKLQAGKPQPCTPSRYIDRYERIILK